jgi:hypothetical protein
MVSGRKIEDRKISQATPARHFSAFNFSVCPPSIGLGPKTSPASERFETIGRLVPIRVIRVIRGFPLWLRLKAALGDSWL